MDLSLGKLQQLVTVARTGSFSRAAAELNLSQPALSRSVAAIEARYGFQIFNRLGHGVELTAAGMQVVELARPLLQGLRNLDSNLRLFGAGGAGVLDIGLAPLLASQLLAQFASDFFGAGTRAQLRVMIRPGEVLLESLKNDLIEMMFFPDGYIAPDAALTTQPVGTLTPVCVVRSGHPLAGREALTLTDLDGFPWASSVAPQIIAETLSPAQFVCDNYHILREAVLATDLVCICSTAFAARQLADGSLRRIEVAGLPLATATIHMAKLRDRVSSPLAEVAVERIRTLLGQESPAIR